MSNRIGKSRREQALEVLGQMGEATAKQVATALRRNKIAVSSMLGTLYFQGALERTAGANNEFRYRLKSKPAPSIQWQPEQRFAERMTAVDGAEVRRRGLASEADRLIEREFAE